MPKREMIWNEYLLMLRSVLTDCHEHIVGIKEKIEKFKKGTMDAEEILLLIEDHYLPVLQATTDRLNKYEQEIGYEEK